MKRPSGLPVKVNTMNALDEKLKIKQQKDLEEAKRKKKFNYVRFAVQLWAVRMGFSMFGMFIPTTMEIYSYIFPTDHSVIYTVDLKEVSWSEIIKSDFQIVRQIREASVPLLINSVPLISPLALRLAFQNVLPVLKMQTKVSSSRQFIYHDSSRIWAKQYNITPDYTYMSTKDYLINEKRYKFPPYSHLEVVKERYNLGNIETESELLSDNELKTCSEKDTSTSHPCIGDIADINQLQNDNAFKQQPVMTTDQVTLSEEQQYTHYMYTVYPGLYPYISALVPSLTHLYYSQSTEPQVSLWMSSTGVRAALHYDMDDNFLLQIAGNKTVIILSPEAYTVVQSYASYHPNWRQTQFSSELFSVETIYNRIHNIDCSSSKDNNNNNNNIVNIDAIIDTQTLPLYNTSNIMIWSVTLTPGDMLYIPSGYYHSVGTEEDSISVNSWYSSTMSEVYKSLQNVPLPFENYDSTATKLAQLSVVIRKLILHYKAVSSFQLFTQLFKKRLEYLIRDLVYKCGGSSSVDESDENTESNQQIGICANKHTGSTDNNTCSLKPTVLCTNNDFLIAETKVVNTRIAGNIYSLLKYAHLSDALTSLLLFDFFEEVLQVILGDNDTTPCVVYDFITQCLERV